MSYEMSITRNASELPIYLQVAEKIESKFFETFTLLVRNYPQYAEYRKKSG